MPLDRQDHRQDPERGENDRVLQRRTPHRDNGDSQAHRGDRFVDRWVQVHPPAIQLYWGCAIRGEIPRI
jgi:hypothetical protein